jgi:hypothetical protein
MTSPTGTLTAAAADIINHTLYLRKSFSLLTIFNLNYFIQSDNYFGLSPGSIDDVLNLEIVLKVGFKTHSIKN